MEVVKKMNDEVYTIPLRVYGPKNIKMVKDLKKEFNSNSLSKCIIQVTQEYYRMKKELEKIQNALRKSIKRKYEISEDAVNDIIDRSY